MMETAVALTIYHNPRCSKSRETLALLENKGVVPRVIEYLKTPPSQTELARILKALGCPAKDIVRKKEAADAKVDVEALTEAGLIAAMVSHPEIIERPIVVNGEKAAIGRPPERVLGIL
ncbi:MAG: arsenate reductase (glutaredoxin) [Proteobacteria bacterium]|nr:arsenate reductase (glutaredoxin) [Pseudomonadota bacterium]